MGVLILGGPVALTINNDATTGTTLRNRWWALVICDFEP